MPEVSPAPATDRRRRQTLVVVVGFVLALLALVWGGVTIRATNASFADREIVGSNRLGAGTLDVEVGEQTVALSASNMAAGDQIGGQIELVNAGSLPLLYALSAFAPRSPLRDALDIVAWVGVATCPADAPTATPTWNVLDSTVVASRVQRGALAPGATVLVCLSARLALTADGSAQGQRLDLIIGIDAEHDVAATTGDGS